MFLLICINSQDVNAAHIVGGDISYSFVSRNEANNTVTLRFTFTMYRDDTGMGAGFDPDAKFGVYRRVGNAWVFVLDKTADPTNETFIEIVESDPCVQIIDQLSIERATYSFTATLDVIDDNYLIVYQRCCRNDNVSNLVNSGEAGAAFTLEIFPEALQIDNSSPVFNFPPPNVICANFPVVYDNSATDPDGNNITYRFCTPLTAGGTDGSGGPGTGDEESCTGVRPDPERCPPPYDNVVFTPGSSGSQPVMGSPPLSINPVTGIVTGEPTTLGLYVLGVCVEEYNNGDLLSIMRSDYQITVGLCSSIVEIGAAANSEYDGETGILSPVEFFVGSESLNVFSCGDLSINLGCDVCRDNYPQSNVRWEIFLPTGTLNSTDYYYEAIFPDYDVYSGVFYFQQEEDSSGCNDTIPIRIEIYPPNFPDFELSFDTCGYDPILVTDMSSSIDDNITSTRLYVNNVFIVEDTAEYAFLPDVLGPLEFRLDIEDSNGCVFTKTKVIEYYPTDGIDISTSNFIVCEPASITFKNAQDLLTDDYDAYWDFGDGSPIVNDIAPTHIYTDTGTFTVSLELFSPTGCSEMETFQNWIRVKESPEAGFSFTPENPTVFQREVIFTDESVDAVSWQWDFGGAGTSLFQNPTFTFPDTGIYDIRLVVSHPSHCPDTLIQRIDISPEVRVFFPNAFTPNNDANNDEFIPIGILDGVNTYSFRIWNRWGEMIFESNQPGTAWNGQKNNSGSLSPEGVYVYTLDYIGPRGGSESYRGQVTLLR